MKALNFYFVVVTNFMCDCCLRWRDCLYQINYFVPSVPKKVHSFALTLFNFEAR